MQIAGRAVGAVRFGSFVADLRSGELFQDGVKARLQEQPFKVLAILLEHPGELVAREDLRRILWPDDSLVDFDHSINVAINKIRVALGDAREGQPFIETVGTRGYRFVRTVEPTYMHIGPTRLTTQGNVVLHKQHSVGRAKEHTDLRAAFESAGAGRGLLVCVTGEAGIGKTTLVEDFLSGLVTNGSAHLVARGRCSERLAGTEAYLPILEALESLLHGGGSKAVTRVMRRLAPTWYAQVVPRSGVHSGAAISSDVVPTSQERLKREVVGFFGEITQRQPLVLFIDDVHWADLSTVDLLAYLGTSLGSLPMLILVTYRPSELFPAKHPFSRIQLDLQTRRVCQETPVEFLSRENIDTYLLLEFPLHRFPVSFSAVIHAKTEGNALFIVDMLRYLKAQQVIAEKEGQWSVVKPMPAIERDMPESVRSMIARKTDQLDAADRTLLTVGAVQGFEFESAVLATVSGRDAAEVEERLEALDRLYGFVRLIGEIEFPDRTATLRYRFVHVLYQNAFYGSLGPSRRAALSGAVAEALLTLHAEHAATIASALAFLFESARDCVRASAYYQLAVQNAARVFAHGEVIALARRGLEMLSATPRTLEAIERELNLQVALTLAMAMSRGYASAETSTEMSRLQEVCEGLGDSPEMFGAWWALWVFNVASANFNKGRELGGRLLAIAEARADPVLLIGASTTLGTILHHQGELLAAQHHLERAVALHDPSQISAYAAVYRSDPGLVARAESIRNLYVLGYPAQAVRRMNETLLLARQSSDQSRAGFPLAFAAFLNQFLGEAGKTREAADECLALCGEYGMPQEQGWVMFSRGWAVAEAGQVDEGIAEIRAALSICTSLGVIAGWPHFLALLAETALRAGKRQEGLAAVAEGLEAAERNGDRVYEAELHRLKGELLLESGASAGEAERCFGDAMRVARKQNAKAFELRAAISLSRICLGQGRRNEARALLQPVYNWFTEGFDTPDLKEAAALLDQVR